LGGRFDWFQFEYIDRLLAGYRDDAVTKHLFSPKFSLAKNIAQSWQIYLRTGMGFHTNDARDVVRQSGWETLPKMLGADFGTIWKPAKNMILQAALWWSKMDQEFVFSGDEGTIEATGRSKRTGIDFSARYQAGSWINADLDINYAIPRYINEPEGQNFIPLAPVLTGVGGVHLQAKSGLGGTLRFRYMAPRPANEDNSVTALGYTVLDAAMLYHKPAFEIAVFVENLLNTEWNEAQFDTESRLPFETEPVSELHFTPGTPFYLKARIAWFF